MAKPVVSAAIRLRGVRHNNLKNFDLDLPVGRLIVITGPSGSGKSSLAFDTLFAEGQRRYIETFSPYARQFFDRMDKPQVDRIEGIPPAIAIEQRNTVRTTRSTVGTMTELCDYLKLLWPHLARLHCRGCDEPVRREPPQAVWEKMMAECGMQNAECLITFEVPLSPKLSLEESLSLVVKQGYQRLLLNGEVVRLEEAKARLAHHASHLASLTIIQDRLRLNSANRARFIEACEQAYRFGKGKLTVRLLGEGPNSKPKTRNSEPFSSGFHCARCNLDYREPTPALFSFNHPLGACPACKGFGRVISIDYDLAIPDRSLPLAGGAVRPWRSGFSAECQQDLLKFCRAREVPTDVPFEELPRHQQDWVINGDPDYGLDDAHEWPHAWYGIKGYFRWLESKAYKMHVRVLLSRYRAYSTCPECQGQRLNPDALLYRLTIHDLRAAGQTPDEAETREPQFVNGKSTLTLAGFYALPVDAALELVEALAARRPFKASDPLSLLLAEVRSRLGYLVEVGLGYLTLDRPTRTLSGGETERVNLTTCLGTRLVNTLFVLDEPSVGLHPRDTARLVRILESLRNAGNTVVVVEHEAGVIRAADHVVDLGPGSGEAGGHVVFQGTFAGLQQSAASLTGAYLSGRKQIEPPARRPVGNPASEVQAPKGPRIPKSKVAAATTSLQNSKLETRNPKPLWLNVRHATRHNLKNLAVDIPLSRFVCLTGVSGSGKTTLARDILLPALQARVRVENQITKASDRLEPDDDPAGDEPRTTNHEPRATNLTGWQHLSNVVLVDQSPLGKTPRSNPAVYIGAFGHIRDLFAQSDLARQRGLSASAFSFNSGQGQCERCRGAGFEKIEMQFLSDVFIRCPDCHGRRYREHILEVKLRGTAPRGRPISASVQGPDEAPPSFGVRQPSAALERDAAEEERQRTAALHDAVAPFGLPLPRGGEEKRRERDRRGGAPSSARPASASREPEPLEARDSEPGTAAWSVADFLDATVDDAVEFLTNFLHLPPAGRAIASLRLLQEVGLGYLRLGQPINTLSGGESQRLKLVSHLAESAGAAHVSARLESSPAQAAQPRFDERSPAAVRPTLFVFDEPTTGLHFDDVRVLLRVFQRLVDAGHSLLVIEHNLDVIKCADWVIDLGPEAGEGGGQLVAAGPPEAIAACAASHTGAALRALLSLP